MYFHSLCGYFQQLENTTKRLDIVELIRTLLTKLEPEEIAPVVYMTSGELGPRYATFNLGIKTRIATQIIAQAVGRSDQFVTEKFQEIGDLGDVIYNLYESGNKQSSIDDWFGETVEKKFTVLEIWHSITQLNELEGKSSQSRKLEIVIGFLKDMSALEAKFYIRIILVNMRLRAQAPTWLDAASKLSEESESRNLLDRAYYILSDLGTVVSLGVQRQYNELRKYQEPILHTPVQCMSAEREKDATAIMDRLGEECLVEDKYDGYRVQIHISKEKTSLFSRNQETYTDQFPDMVEALKGVFNDLPIIVEGEIVAYDYKSNSIQSFQVLTGRSRKYDIPTAVKDIPVKIYVFDVLFYKEKSYLDISFKKRRELLEHIIIPNEKIELARAVKCTTAEQLESLLLASKEKNLEGIMAKDIRPHAVYQAGGRGFGWIKYKADYVASLADTFDLFLVGGYYGRGKRAGTYGTYLMAAWDEDEGLLKTFCKVGAGFSDEDLVTLSQVVDTYKVSKRPVQVQSNEIPDQWFDPKIVLEIEGAEISSSPIHTVGPVGGEYLALRFPRFKRIRSDKFDHFDLVTKVSEIISIYARK